MSDLHTVNKSPFERDSLNSCLKFSLAGSTVLLIEDGVYAAVKGTAVADKVQAALGERKICALDSDLKARGIAADRVIDGIELVDYAGFVDLVEANEKVQSWL